MVLVTLLIGLALLFFGRKLFWLAGAAAGFLVATGIAHGFFHAESGTGLFVLAVAVGLVAGLIAFFMQKVAVWIVGFLAGGFFLMNVVDRFGGSLSQFPWLMFVVGGIIGGLLVYFLLEWALILVSSLVGAFVVAHAIDLGAAVHFVVVVALFIVGVVVQTRLKRDARARKKPAPEKTPSS